MAPGSEKETGTGDLDFFFFFLSQSLFGTKEVSPRKMSVSWAFSYLYQAA